MRNVFAISDEFVSSGLAIQSAGNRKLRGFVIGAIEVLFIKISVCCAAGIKPNHDDHA